MEAKQYTITVFNVELEGIDKCGKDTIRNTMLNVFPNVCSIKARGILSQLAYERLYNRPWTYPVSEGYIKNTFIVKLDINEDDWINRLTLSNEIENNAKRSDVDFIADYKRHMQAFEDAWNYFRNLDVAKNYQDHFLCCNTSVFSAVEIANLIRLHLIKLNHLDSDFKL